MIIRDILDIVAPTDPSMVGKFLAPVGSGGNPNITYLSPQDNEGNIQLVYCKGFVTKSGKILGDPAQASLTDPVIGLGPWDWMTATPQWLRQRMTERLWSNLATGKLESVSGLGVRRLPRWIIYTPGCQFSFSWTMNRPETDYLIIDPPAVGTQYPTITKNTDAGVRCTFHGPYPGAAILDSSGKVLLPAGEDWAQDYEWGGKPSAAGVMIYSTLESLLFRVGIGRYSWLSWLSDGLGSYNSTPNAQSMQSVIKPMPVGLKPLQNVF